MNKEELCIVSPELRMRMIGTGQSPSLANLGVLLNRENNTMISLTHGMTPGGNVGDALTRILRLRGHDWLAVVRSIDSASTTAELTKALAFHHLAYDLINGNVCLSIETLQRAVSSGAFTGFDEVWIVAGSPPAYDLASLPSATSDGADFMSDLPEELSRAMQQTNCVLILGDGCGLNYATTSPQLQEELVEAGP
jgi:hypothetical protein